MAHPRDIIIGPIITEKSNALSAEGKYVFKVKRDANKIEIARAVEKIFDVRVVAVNTINVPGKLKRQGRSEGMTPAWKKAIVTLQDGETIPLFEGV
ncbi:MAG: 50S ribosomal protein L23 [Bacillota bacterium]|jgi:large subunit ribosomal protein L23|nr:50S ribosomal protein L23 [Bacillota bacterium]HOB42369.1 50S ribosomal protein L23 [Bacillota bacterium]HOK69978.1 50S ribosomal protein L23 [Bacillota bacterium]HOL52143.1 50S ribosomal protein L23 [Bacillota bacterium]HOO30394.1 50S ribosomal protein L23 [Bacillota bacterium]